MRRWSLRRLLASLVVMSSATVPFLNGCDPGLRATTENGIITISQALLLSLFQAGIQLSNEQLQNP